ncbi:MAG TPA: thioester reductase domain-containing protein [Vicinamibacterales bacterium]|nr:thioester reductase domain-containing protein [Vicinamibacterales bacterium]
MPSTDLRTYITLPDDLAPPAAGLPVAPPSCVLLTGATGYLGAYLLRALLDRSEATIVCLVRTNDAHAGLARIQANLARYDLGADVSRIDVRPGAVEEPRLGLDGPTWQALARDVDVIVHAAANVNFMPTLDRLRPVNVGGVVNLLRLAAHTRPKTLHLASSYSVFNEASYAGVPRVTEDPLIGHGAGFRVGYPMSKWIAERVTDLARERGWSVATHRLGLLWGDARSGRSKADDLLTLIVRACLVLGRAQDVDFLMHVTPVDFAAAAVAEVALAPAEANGHYHAVTETPIAWRDFVRAVREQGHTLDLVSTTAWHDALRAALPAHREFTTLAVMGAQDPTRGFSDANIFSMQFDASRLRAALAGTDVVCPPLDRRLIGTYLNAIARDTPA